MRFTKAARRSTLALLCSAAVAATIAGASPADATEQSPEDVARMKVTIYVEELKFMPGAPDSL